MIWNGGHNYGVRRFDHVVNTKEERHRFDTVDIRIRSGYLHACNRRWSNKTSLFDFFMVYLSRILVWIIKNTQKSPFCALKRLFPISNYESCIVKNIDLTHVTTCYLASFDNNNLSCSVHCSLFPSPFEFAILDNCQHYFTSLRYNWSSIMFVNCYPLLSHSSSHLYWCSRYLLLL